MQFIEAKAGGGNANQEYQGTEATSETLGGNGSEGKAVPRGANGESKRDQPEPLNPRTPSGCPA
jgi:hypothetical protein